MLATELACNVRTATVGVLGVGVVGSAVRSCFEGGGRTVRCYDKFNGEGSIEEINQADIVFVCVPTPYVENRGLDSSAVEDAVSRLDGEKIVVLKSTSMPGTTELLQRRYPRHHFFFNPEFLRENRAVQDFLEPDRQLMGYCNDDDRELAAELLTLLPRAPYEAVIAATSAELIKLFTNSMLALRVIFANQVYDLSDALGVDYEEVLKGIAADPRIGGSHLNVFDAGYRGYGGKCLPKDVSAVCAVGRDLGAPMQILEAVQQANARHRAAGLAALPASLTAAPGERAQAESLRA
jgi:UDPglucose 6-dehydrogenase